MLWEFRYRARKVDDVILESDHDDEAEGRAVAEDHLQQLNTPNAVFIRLRRLIANSSAMMRARAAAAKEPDAAETSDDKTPAPRVPKGRDAMAGRIGA